MAKMWCENGKSIVRKWWFRFAISVEIHCVTAVAWCNASVATLKSAKSYCIFSECGGGFLHFGFQFGGSMVWKWRFELWISAVGGTEMAVLWCDFWVLDVWFLYDCVANWAFGNL